MNTREAAPQLNLPIKVAQSLAWYFPQSGGGTESYVRDLLAGLKSSAVESTVITPAVDVKTARYEHDGATVLTYPGKQTGRELGLSRERRLDQFATVLSDSECTVYHQHSWTPDCGFEHLRRAKQAGLKTVLTLHTATILCLRGTLIRGGKAACNGVVEEKKCAQCWIQSRGLGQPWASLVSGLSTLTGPRVRSFVPGRVRTALSARTLAKMKSQVLSDAVRHADKIIVLCQWMADALRGNGVTEDKICLSPHGIVMQPLEVEPVCIENDVIKVGFLGRADPSKGLAVLLEGFVLAERQRDPAIRSQLHLYVMAVTDEDQAYLRRLQAAYAAYDTILWHEPVPRGQVASLLRCIHILAVPSQTLETGPLVVLEAMEAAVDVVGSDLGGVRELLQRYDWGALAHFSDPEDWALCLNRRITQQQQLPRKRPSLRRLEDVCNDMIDVYQAVNSTAPCDAQA